MLKLIENIDFTNYTLVLPSVAVGNVGQLTVDLLISSLSLKKCGSVIDSAFIPIVGPNPYNEDSEDICTAVDVYVNDEAKIVVFQIRTLLINDSTSFFELLVRMVKEKNIKKVIILTSCYDQEKRDEEIRTTPLRYIATEELSSEYREFFSKNNWMPFQIRESSIIDDFIPGGGYAMNFQEMFKQHKISSIILIKFCSEGDNIPDAISLFQYFNAFLTAVSNTISLPSIKYPSSWKYLFGNSPPKEIY